MFPLGVYCAYLKSVNRDAFPFIAIVDDLLREQHLKNITPSDVHKMTHSLIDTDTNTNTEACATPLYHKQAAESISTSTSRSFSLPSPTTISTNDHISTNNTLDALDLKKELGVQISNTSIQNIGLALPSHGISTMPTTMQAVQSGQSAAVTASKTWAGVATGPCQSSATTPKVEAPANVDASVKTDTAVPFQRQLNGNQLRKAKRRYKAGAEAHANEEIPDVIVAETGPTKVQCPQKSTPPIEDQPGTSKTGQGHRPNTTLSSLGSSVIEQKDARVDNDLDIHWPALSDPNSPPNECGRTHVVKLPGIGCYRVPVEDPSPPATVEVEFGLPKSSTQASLEVDHQQPQSSTPILEQVDDEPLQVHSAEVKPKTKAQKKNERRRNAKKATKLKEEEEAAALSLATASALAESISQSAYVAEAEIKTKPETIKETNQRRKGPGINKSGKPANVISKSTLVAKANPSAVKPVPVKAKSALAFGSVPSSSFEPMLSEKPQELQWDVPYEQTTINASRFQVPVFAGSNNIPATNNTEQEMREPLMESMSTTPTPHSGLFTIPSEMKDCKQSIRKQGLFDFSSPSINLCPPTAKEGLVSFPTERNSLNIPTPSQGLAPTTPKSESLNLFGQHSSISSVDRPSGPLEEIPDMIPENVTKMTSEDAPMMTREVVSEDILDVDSSVLFPEILSEGSADVVAEVVLEATRDVIEDTIESDDPQSSSDPGPAQSQLTRISEWREDLYFSDVADWMFYGYGVTQGVGDAGPFDIVQLVACHKESELTYIFRWEVPHMWGEPKPLHLQSPPTPSHFVEFWREIFEIFDEEMDISQANGDGTEAETGQVTIKVDIADDDSSAVITDSLVMAEALQLGGIYDAVLHIIQPSSTESRSSLVEHHHAMDDSIPFVPHVYNIRENEFFFLPPKDEMSDAIGNTDVIPPAPQNRNIQENVSLPEEEYNIMRNVYFFMSKEADVSNTVMKSGSDYPIDDACSERGSCEEGNNNKDDGLPPVSQDLNIQENLVLPEEDYDIMKNVYFFMSKEADVPDTVMRSNSDHRINGSCLERESMDRAIPPVSQNSNIQENVILPEEGYDIMKNVYFFMSKNEDVSDGSISKREPCGQENHNMDSTIPPVSRNSNIQENVILPDQGYDIMKNVYFFMSKEDDVSDRAMTSNSSDLNDGANIEDGSCEKEIPIGASLDDSPGDSPYELASRPGILVSSSFNFEVQEQFRSAVWATRNAPSKVNHSHNVSNATTGTLSSLDELRSVPSITSFGSAEGEDGLAGNSVDTELIKADEDHIALSAPVEISHQDSSQQKEGINNFVYKFGTATVWAGKQGLEVGKAAFTIALIPTDIAIRATVSTFKATQTSFWIGRWACARFGPRWLARFVGA